MVGFALRRRLSHALARRVPAPWRARLLSLRPSQDRRSRGKLLDETAVFYPTSWRRPLVVVVQAPGEEHQDQGVLYMLQQSGWPVAFVWHDGHTHRGHISGTSGGRHNPNFPANSSTNLTGIAASTIPEAVVAPLGVVMCISQKDEALAESVASQLGYLHLAITSTKLEKDPAALLATLFPKVSILLPVHNQKLVTSLCLASLYAFTDYPNWEVVAVDNGSTDGTFALLAQWVKEQKNFRLIKNESNRGFPAACNQAARAATGEILCVLNNDTVVTPGWLSCLVDELLRSPGVGLVGPVSNGVANEAQVHCPVRSLEELPLWSMARQKRYFRRTRTMSVLALFCAATWKSVWDSLGGLDEDFGPGLFEDDDFSFRLREKDLTLCCRLDAYVHHFQGSSFGHMENEAYLKLFERNRKLFWTKLRQRRRQR